jgi:hypothetical protein
MIVGRVRMEVRNLGWKSLMENQKPKKPDDFIFKISIFMNY